MELLQKINEISVGLGILVFGLFLLVNWWKGRANRLDVLLTRVFAASAIPTGIVLLLCAFEPTLIIRLGGLNIHIAVAGMALLYVSFKSLLTNDTDDDTQSDSTD